MSEIAERYERVTAQFTGQDRRDPVQFTATRRDGRPCAPVRSGPGGVSQRFVEVVTQAIRRDDEEDLELLAVTLVHAPVRDGSAVGLELVSDASDVRDANRRAILR